MAPGADQSPGTSSTPSVSFGDLDLADTPSVLGDVDGDGFDDLVVGGRLQNEGYRAWLLYRPLAPGIDVGALNVSHAGLDGAAFTSTTYGSTRGPTVAGGGDADGDGVPDFALAGPEASPTPFVTVWFGWQGSR